jgi:hypothetical protein
LLLGRPTPPARRPHRPDLAGFIAAWWLPSGPTTAGTTSHGLSKSAIPSEICWR